MDILSYNEALSFLMKHLSVKFEIAYKFGSKRANSCRAICTSGTISTVYAAYNLLGFERLAIRVI